MCNRLRAHPAKRTIPFFVSQHSLLLLLSSLKNHHLWTLLEHMRKPCIEFTTFGLVTARGTMHAIQWCCGAAFNIRDRLGKLKFVHTYAQGPSFHWKIFSFSREREYGWSWRMASSHDCMWFLCELSSVAALRGDGLLLSFKGLR